MRSRPRTLVALALLAAGPAAAHEVRYEVRRGSAIAVRVYHEDDEALADGAYRVYSPADAKTPHQRGRTDRNGWLAFVPDAPGKWRIRVVDDTGHGLDIELDAELPAGEPAGPDPAHHAASGVASALRPLGGLALIAAVFGALFLAYRRRRGAS